MTNDFRKILIFHLLLLTNEQMKESTTAGYLTAERKSFHDINRQVEWMLT